jgi:ketosteroid isomerase-like protein
MFSTPEEAEHAFYEALDQGDAARLMQVWSDDEEIVCIHPGGMRITGHDAVRDSWQMLLSTVPTSVRPLRPVVMRSMLCVVHMLIEQVTVHTPEGIRHATCYATNVYHNGPAGWRMVLHHASPAPPDAGVLDLHDMPDRLH